MKMLTYVLFLTFVIPSLVYSAPGDTITTFDLTGEPEYVNGLAKDWVDGGIWVAGCIDDNNNKFGKFDPVTHNMIVDWINIDSSLKWVHDIGYGYKDAGTTYLIMNDLLSPYTRMIDPADGSYDGYLPDYYWADGYTYGCAVDTDTNDVYISSYETWELVYYDGTTWDLYDNAHKKNPGIAIGWGKIFVFRGYVVNEIDIFDLATHTLEGTIPLNDLSDINFPMGIACGQEDIVGNNESIFITCTKGIKQIVEVEVGDYTTPGGIETSSLGSIKASFR